MSSEINVKLKRKGQSHKDSITLLWLSTTPTRDLCEQVSLIYCGGRSVFENEFEAGVKKEVSDTDSEEYGLYTILTTEKLNEILKFYDDKIDIFSSALKNTKERLVKLEQYLMNAKTAEVYTSISDDMSVQIQDINEITEFIEEYKYLKNYWTFAVQNVFENNSPYSVNETNEYELIYYRD